MQKGLIIVNTGNGKGKTTAALGLAIRAWGQGLKVLILQFIKGSWKYGELAAISKMDDNIVIMPLGEGFTNKNLEEKEKHKFVAIEALTTAEKEVKSKVKTALENVASHLGNTATVCRKYYVHPLIVNLYENNSIKKYLEELDQIEINDGISGLISEEKAVMRILENEKLR